MALSFNGTDQTACVNNDVGVTGGTITLSIWAKLNGEIASGIWCFVLQSDVGTHVKYAIYYDYNSGSRRLNFQRTRFGVIDVSSYYTITMGTSDWYHLVLTYDNANVRGYVNGALVAGPTSTTGDGSSGGADVVYIASEGGSMCFANSTLCDVRICNRALTANEIAEIYTKRGADKVWQGLVGWWRLDIPQCPPAMTANNAPSPVVISASHESTWGSGAPAYCGCYNCNYGTHYAYFSSYPYGPANEWWKIDLGSAKAFKSLTYNNHSGKGIKRGYVQASNNNSDWTTLYDGTGSDWPTGTITINFSSNETAYRYWRLYATAGYGSNSIQFSDFRFYPIEGICPDLSGNGNHGTPYYGPTYQDSPHRLRRGILVS